MGAAQRDRPPHRVRRDFRLPVLLCKHSGRRRLWWAAMALGMVALRIALLPLLPVPSPQVHDEFSYLLAADTFAHGRVVNPPLEPAASFESPHILLHPVYASKYPPGQGLVLAFGQVVLGDPYWGVVLSCALMVFLFCWAADAWLPPQWTLVTGGLACTLFFIRYYWFTSYWGGAVAACGGALIVGGVGRILAGRYRGARASLAAGAVLLYVSRPYEGAMLCLAVLAILGVHLVRLGADQRKTLLRRVVLPNALLVAAAVPVFLVYNTATTGKPTDLLYLVHSRQYMETPLLWFLPPQPAKPHASQNTQRTSDWERETYEHLHNQPIYTALTLQTIFIVFAMGLLPFLGFGLLLAGIPWARSRTGKRWLVWLWLFGLLTMYLEVWVQEHYGAPFTAVGLILIVASGRALWYRAAATRWGAAAVAAAMLVFFIPLGITYAGALGSRPTERAKLVAKLKAMPGRDLVFVSYDKDWDFLREWVYNNADPDASEVVFAHLRTAAENQAVMDRFPGRSAWLLRLGPQQTDVHLAPYDASYSQATGADSAALHQ